MDLFNQQEKTAKQALTANTLMKTLKLAATPKIGTSLRAQETRFIQTNIRAKSKSALRLILNLCLNCKMLFK